MIIQNPTDSTVEITIEGTTKVVEPQSKIVVDDNYGMRWLKTHEFLQAISDVAKVAKAEVKDVLEEMKDVIDETEDAIEKVSAEVKKVIKKK